MGLSATPPIATGHILPPPQPLIPARRTRDTPDYMLLNLPQPSAPRIRYRQVEALTINTTYSIPRPAAQASQEQIKRITAEQEIEYALAEIEWGETLRQAQQKAEQKADMDAVKLPQSGADKCPCDILPSRMPDAVRGFGYPSLNISHATLLTQFHLLLKSFRPYSGTVPEALGAEIHQHKAAISCVIGKLQNRDPQAKYLWKREDMHTGIRATFLLTRLRGQTPSSDRTATQRPAWKS